MSDNSQSTPPAPFNGDSGSASTQPQTRRERRLLEEARARVHGVESGARIAQRVHRAALADLFGQLN